MFTRFSAQKPPLYPFFLLEDYNSPQKCLSYRILVFHPFIANIKEPAGTAFICLASRLELDAAIYQPMHSLNQALDFPLSFGIERL